MPTDAELLEMVLWEVEQWRKGKHTAHKAGCRAEQCRAARARSGWRHPPGTPARNRVTNAFRAQSTLEAIERLVRERRLPPALGGPHVE